LPKGESPCNKNKIHKKIPKFGYGKSQGAIPDCIKSEDRFPVSSMNAYRVIRVTAPPIFNQGIRRGKAVNFTSRPLYYGGEPIGLETWWIPETVWAFGRRLI
jgi:hypothetical protein